MVTPHGTFIYTYDALNRLVTITNPNNEVTTFAYDAISRRTSRTYDNGIVTTFTYDAGSRLTNMLTRDSHLVTLNSYVYTYDKVGNRLSMTDNAGLHEYAYDDVYQLEVATHPQAYNPDESFTYDNVGNRLASHLSGDYDYDNLLNRLLEDDTYTYIYDNNGNLTSKTNKATTATTTYQYDTEDRLVQVTTPTDVIQYLYDGLGRRNVRTLNGMVTRYVYDQEDILFEFDENDQIKARYTHGPGIDEPISVDRDTDADGTLDTTYYYHYDGLGSVVAMTDSAGNVVQTYVYDTFGNIVQQSGNVENVYTYTGREWDTEAGLYYYRARYYDPTLGRFINGDPIGFAGGDVNFYVYVQNNPVNFIDPEGLFFVPGAIAGAIISGTGALFGTIAQGGSFNDVVINTAIGIGTGGLIGGLPGLGGAMVSGIVGASSNLIGQKFTNPCGGINWSSAIGAGLGGLVGGRNSKFISSFAQNSLEKAISRTLPTLAPTMGLNLVGTALGK